MPNAIQINEHKKFRKQEKDLTFGRNLICNFLRNNVSAFKKRGIWNWRKIRGSVINKLKSKTYQKNWNPQLDNEVIVLVKRSPPRFPMVHQFLHHFSIMSYFSLTHKLKNSIYRSLGILVFKESKRDHFFFQSFEEAWVFHYFLFSYFWYFVAAHVFFSLQVKLFAR